MPPIHTDQVLSLQALLQDPVLRARLGQLTTLEALVDGLCQASSARGTPLTRTDVLNALTAAGTATEPDLCTGQAGISGAR